MVDEVQIDAFLEDFDQARERAVALDEKIMSAAAQISPHYVDLVSLAARQTLASLDVTVGSDLKLSDVKIFMKDLGTTQ